MKKIMRAFLFWVAVAGIHSGGINPASGQMAESLQKEFSKKRMKMLPQVLIRYKSGGAEAARSRMMKTLSAVPRKKLRSIGIDVVPVPAGQTMESFIAHLKKDSNIEFVEPNGVVRALAIPNDPEYSSQYYLNGTFTNVETAWDMTQGNPAVTVAVLDSGIALTHPDLAPNLWVNPAPSGNAGLHGTRIELDWNANGDCTDTDPEFGPDQCASADPTDDNTATYHGTQVAGVIGASINNNLNIAGVAPQCPLMAVKVLNSEGTGTYESIAEGIHFAVAHGASIINLSLGGIIDSLIVTEAINKALAAQVVVVAAAGNDGNDSEINFPARLPAVIAVGAIGQTKELSFYSSTGANLDVVAPGNDIVSTFPPSGTQSTIGTSYSAAQVTGLAALIRSVDPEASVQEVTQYIIESTQDLGAPGFDNKYGYGLINAASAVINAHLGLLRRHNAPPTVALNIPPSGLIYDAPATITLTANAHDSDGTIDKIQFFEGSHKIGEDFDWPFEINWVPETPGAYHVIARAFDNNGKYRDSEPLLIQVNTAPVAASTTSRNLARPDRGEDIVVVKNITAGSYLRARVFARNGALIRNVLDQDQPAGDVTIRWDCRNEDNELVATAIYYMVIETQGKTEKQPLAVRR